MARLACWVPAAQRSPRVLVARIPKIALLEGVVTRIAGDCPPPVLYRFGEGSGLAACGAEVEQDVGRQGGEGELLGLVDQDVVPAMCWLCFRVRGRLRVGRPVMWRSGRVRVAKVVKGSWVSRMMRIVALDCGLLTPPRVISLWGSPWFVENP